KLVLVAKGHWFERKDRFTCLVHWLNRVLETRRGGHRAKMTSVIHDNCYACRNGCPTNPGDKCPCVGSCRADADGPGLERNTTIGDIDIVIAGREILPGRITQSDVAAGGCVSKARIKIDARG